MVNPKQIAFPTLVCAAGTVNGGCGSTPPCEKTGRRAFGKVNGFAQVAYQYQCPDGTVYWSK